MQNFAIYHRGLLWLKTKLSLNIVNNSQWEDWWINKLKDVHVVKIKMLYLIG